jgi:uncharacterized membrane protein YcaP (DUF421 family)
VDWGELFGLTVNPLELVVRGSVMYWFIIVLFRVLLRRRVGAVGIADILLLVLIADAAQNAMAGEYKSITDGALLVATILGWTVLIDWATYRFPRIADLLQPAPLPLIQHGRMNRRNMREELLTEDELLAKLREQGIERIEDVRRATMESDGAVTVVRYEGRNRAQPARKQPV